MSWPKPLIKLESQQADWSELKFSSLIRGLIS